MRFRLVLPEEYPDQGPGGQNFPGKKQESTSAQVVAVVARLSFREICTLRRMFSIPWLKAQFLRAELRGFFKKFMAAHQLKREFIIPQFIPSRELTYPLPRHF